MGDDERRVEPVDGRDEDERPPDGPVDDLLRALEPYGAHDDDVLAGLAELFASERDAEAAAPVDADRLWARVSRDLRDDAS